MDLRILTRQIRYSIAPTRIEQRDTLKQDTMASDRRQLGRLLYVTRGHDCKMQPYRDSICAYPEPLDGPMTSKTTKLTAYKDLRRGASTCFQLTEEIRTGILA